MIHLAKSNSRDSSARHRKLNRVTHGFQSPIHGLVCAAACFCLIGCQTLKPWEQQAAEEPVADSQLTSAIHETSTPKLSPALSVEPLLGEAVSSACLPTSPESALLTERLGKHLTYGFDLASRGSMFHARENFLETLRSIANKHDSRARDTQHSLALSEALTALEEVDSIAEHGLFTADRESLQAIVAKHKTRIANNDLPECCSGLALAQQYLALAEQQLTVSAAADREASLALYALARVELIPRFGSLSPKEIRRGRAATLLQAAIRVDENNAIAHNELGILMAHAEQYATAEQLLRKSAALTTNEAVLTNLASVYRLAGKEDLAKETDNLLAARTHNKRIDCSSPTSKLPIQWVSIQEFANGRVAPATDQSFHRPGSLKSQIRQVNHHEPTSTHTVLSQLEPLPIPEAIDIEGTSTAIDAIAEPANVLNSGSACNGSCSSTPSDRCGIHCTGEDCCGRKTGKGWACARPIPWEVFSQGDYVGPARTPHLPEYRLRVDDQLEFVYRVTAEATSDMYRIRVGDIFRIESETRAKINREVVVQPDGKISVVSLGQVHAEGLAIEELRLVLESRLSEVFTRPAISVLPVKLNSKIEELRASVDSRSGNGGQSRRSRVTPEGTVQLPGIGSVQAQGLSLEELKIEIEIRHQKFGEGIEITPVLLARAPRYLYVLGEAKAPGRYSLEGPTSVTQAIAMAGGWNVGADLRRVVVLRRDSCWRLMATKTCLHDALYGKSACPDDLWLRDSDVVLIPKRKSLVLDEAIELVFTRGIYGVIPFGAQYQFTNFRTF